MGAGSRKGLKGERAYGPGERRFAPGERFAGDISRPKAVLQPEGRSPGPQARSQPRVDSRPITPGDPPSDDQRARDLLTALAREAPGAAVLWRGPELTSSDVDVVTAPGRTHDVARVLRDAGLSPAPQDDGRVMWRSFAGDGVVIDVMPARAWPSYYPSLERVLERARDENAPLPVAAAGDRLLIRAAELVGGRPVDHIARKVRPLLVEPGAREELREVAAAEHAAPLAELIAGVDALERDAGPGPLPFARAAAVARRSPQARAALRIRAGRVVGRVDRPPPPEGAWPGGGLVVALSGMDGSGKSTAALELVARLEEQGRPAMVSWSRLAAENELLDLIAKPVRRILRRKGSTAAPEATAGFGTDTRGDVAAASDGPGDAPARSGGGPVESVWVAIVAAMNARTARRTARLARDGVIVVCDRWLTDALVDLELRYGHHRAAAWILRRATPRADLAALLEIDAATSVARKPGDHAPAVLERMAALYADAAAELGFPPAGAEPRDGQVRIDGRGPREDVLAALESRVGAAVAARGVSG